TYLGVGTMLVALIAFFAASQPEFLTYDNLINILETNAVLLVVSVGLTFVMLTGGFDLSIGGVLALSGVLLSKLLGGGVPTWVAVALVLGAGILMGSLLNGVPIASLGVSFFVVTLGMLALTRGLGLVWTDGQTQGLYDETGLRTLADGRVAGIPASVLIAVGVLLAGGAVTRSTGFGRMVYVVGGNAEAARLAGIDVVRVRIAVYALCGGLAALAGTLEAGRLAAAAPDTDVGIELTAAAAVLLGGTSFVGGSGGMLGTFLGTLFLGVLQNGLIIASISAYWQGVISGAVLVMSVLIDRSRRRRATA
ncbi:MAG: ABC transporter permease, partial [Actinobacteria bacterium]|nr:ABC transporter permease [Actinomycetota bacterium]